MRPAAYAEKREESKVGCLLCPHGCVIAPGKKGMCGARVNRGGELYAENYGRVTSLALDPVEKKPLYHFHPGGMILSLGSYGCNLRCPFCQNHEISMQEAPWREMRPEEVASLSLALAAKGNIGAAYTYNEPLIGYEFVRDCAALIRRQGQKNALVTNGFLREAPLRELLPLIDAMNIDLKSFSPGFYREIRGELEAVKAVIALAAGACHLEVTTLVIPGKNDSEEETEALAAWLAGVDPNIPLHLSRFFPRYKLLDTPPTPVAAIRRLAKIAGKHLRYVYAGNC